MIPRITLHGRGISSIKQKVNLQTRKYLLSLLCLIFLVSLQQNAQAQACDIGYDGTTGNLELFLNTNGTATLNAAFLEQFVSSSDCNGGTLTIYEDNAGVQGGLYPNQSRTFDCDDVPFLSETVWVTMTGPGTESPALKYVIEVKNIVTPTILNCTSQSVMTDMGLCTADLSGTITAQVNYNCTSQTAYMVEYSRSDVAGGAWMTGDDAGAGTPFAIGATTVNYRVTYEDENGASQTETCMPFTITVTDGQAPVVSNCPSDATLSNDAGDCSAMHTWNHPFVDDTNGCGFTLERRIVNNTNNSSSAWITVTPSTAMTASPETFNFLVGSYTVQYRAMDANNTDSSCSFDVTVNDTEDPDFGNTPPMISVTPGGCDATVTFDIMDYTVTDNCDLIGDLTFTNDAPNGNGTTNINGTYALGTYTINYTVTDESNNQASHVLTLEIADNSAPTANCASQVVSLASNGQGDITAVSFDDGSVDAACPMNVLTYEVAIDADNSGTLNGMETWETILSFDCMDLAGSPFDILFRVQDMAGNYSMVDVCTLTIEDNEAPDAQCRNITLPITSGCSADLSPSDIDAGSNDNCGPITLTIAEDMNGNGMPDEAFSAGPISLDSCKSYTVFLKVTDDEGNESICSSQVFVEDQVDPVADGDPFTLDIPNSGSITLNASDIDDGSSDNCNLPVDLIYEIAIDNDQDGNIDEAYAAAHTLDCSDVGTADVYLRVTDKCGNSDIDGPSTLTIRDLVLPTAVCAAPFPISIDNLGQVTVTASDIDNGSSDNCSIDTYEIVKDANNDGMPDGAWGMSVSYGCADIGSADVLLRVRDVNGNLSDSCATTITIMDGEAPVPVCDFNNTIPLTSGGTVPIYAFNVEDGSFDNCTPQTMLLFRIAKDENNDGQPDTPWSMITPGVGPNPFPVDYGDPIIYDCDDIGINNIILQVEDAGGNTSICTRSIIIQENLPPVLTTPMDVDIDCSASFSTADTGMATATDNCDTDVDVTSADVDRMGPFGCDTIRVIERTWTATDDAGNSVSQTQTIYLLDETGPSFTVPAAITVACISDTIPSVSGDVTDERDDCTTSVIDASYSDYGIYNFDFTTDGSTAGTGPKYVTSDTVQLTSRNVGACPGSRTIVSTPNNMNVYKVDLTSVTGAPMVFFDWSYETDDAAAGYDPLECIFRSSTAFIGSTIFLTDGDLGTNTGATTQSGTEAIMIPAGATELRIIQRSSDGTCGAATSTITNLFIPVTITPKMGCQNDTIARNWVAADTCGNSNSQWQIIQVIDDIAPSFNFPPLVQLNATNNCTLAADTMDLTNNIVDNCGAGIASISYTVDDGTSITSGSGADASGVYAAGTYDFEFTITDVCGNMTTGNTTLQVVDSEFPTVICGSSLNITGNVPYTLSPSAIGTGTDNCGVVSELISINDPDGDGLPAASYLPSITFNCGDIVDVNGDPVTFTVSYMATDATGKSSICTRQVTLQSNSPVTITCSPNLTIDCADDRDPDNNPSLGEPTVGGACNAGTVLSYMDASDFGPFVSDTCELVTRTWTGNNGASSDMCIQYIAVIDDEDPVLAAAPANILVDCDAVPGASSLTATDNCDSDPMVGSSDLSTQGNSTTASNYYNYVITRTWTATDNCNNSSSAVQTITVQDTTKPVINFPMTHVISNDLGQCNAVVTSANLDLLSFISDNCAGDSDLSISYTLSNATGATTLNPSGSCMAGNCAGLLDATYDVGTYTFDITVSDPSSNMMMGTLNLEIEDDESPDAVCIAEINLVLNSSGVGNIVPANVDNGSSDNCTASVNLSLNQSTFTNADIGATSVTLTATDDAGNSDACFGTVNVFGCLTVNPGSESGTAGDIITVPITSENFTNVNALGVRIELANPTGQTVGTVVGITNVHPTISAAPGTPVSMTNDTVFLNWSSLTATTIATGQTLFEVQVQLNAMAASGDMANLITVGTPSAALTNNGTIIPFTPCTGPDGVITVVNSIPMVTISGTIETEELAPVGNANVDAYDYTGGMQGASVGTDLTASGAGMFNITIPSGGDYLVEPEKNTPYTITDLPIVGINLTDYIIIQGHLNNDPTYIFTSPLKKIAADVFRDGVINIVDLLFLQAFILNPLDGHNNNTNWRFVSKDYTFPVEPKNNITMAYDQNTALTNVMMNQTTDFWGVRIGDLNADSSPDQLTSSTTRDDDMLYFNVDDVEMVAGDEYVVDFKAKDFNAITGFQFTLDFDPTALELVNTGAGNLVGFSTTNFGMDYTEYGKLTTVWADLSNPSMNNDELIFSVTFRALNSGDKLSDLIEINSSITEEFGINADQDILGIDIDFNPAVTTSTVNPDLHKFQLRQNKPNPFNGETVISFDLPEAANAVLSIMDLSGKVLKTYEENFQRGLNNITVKESDLPSSGVLLYKLETPTHTATRKMILID